MRRTWAPRSAAEEAATGAIRVPVLTARQAAAAALPRIMAVRAAPTPEASMEAAHSRSAVQGP